MHKTGAKLPKPSKIKRKLVISKERITRLIDEKPPVAEEDRGRCTYYGTGCLPYTC